jgi:hypothetical protein
MRFYFLYDNQDMNNNRNHIKLACEYTPAEIKKLAKFFELLSDAEKAQEGCNENQECNYQTSRTQ